MSLRGWWSERTEDGAQRERGAKLIDAREMDRPIHDRAAITINEGQWLPCYLLIRRGGCRR